VSRRRVLRRVLRHRVAAYYQVFGLFSVELASGVTEVRAGVCASDAGMIYAGKTRNRTAFAS
jgi:hypothetical protein